MSELTELYQKLEKQMRDIGASCVQEAKANAVIETAGAEDAAEMVKERLKQLEEYERVILWCRGIAEKHISSVNTLPVAPREIDMSRIRGWTRLIDQNSYDDPYARRVYTLAKSNELYIASKRRQLNDILTVLGAADEEEAARKVLEEHEEDVRSQLKSLLESDDFRRLQELLTDRQEPEQEPEPVPESEPEPAVSEEVPDSE